MLQTLRYGIRSLLKSPGFTIMVVLLLGVGFGLITAIFSLVDAVLLRPLACPRSERQKSNLLTESSSSWRFENNLKRCQILRERRMSILLVTEPRKATVEACSHSVAIHATE
jgi:hypothetical protein